MLVILLPIIINIQSIKDLSRIGKLCTIIHGTIYYKNLKIFAKIHQKKLIGQSSSKDLTDCTSHHQNILSIFFDKIKSPEVMLHPDFKKAFFDSL